MRRWFDGRTAYEMRLWNALELGLLAPFHYFGIHDGQDLSHVRFTGGRYDEAELSALYTGNDARVRLVLQEIARVMGSPTAIRALGFCVSVEHARFMARRFTEAGVESAAVTGDSSRDEREGAIRRLEKGELKVLFTVDLFNEGVDIPSVDTVLFLRPTSRRRCSCNSSVGDSVSTSPRRACRCSTSSATPTRTSASTCATFPFLRVRSLGAFSKLPRDNLTYVRYGREDASGSWERGIRDHMSVSNS